LTKWNTNPRFSFDFMIVVICHDGVRTVGSAPTSTTRSMRHRLGRHFWPKDFIGRKAFEAMLIEPESYDLQR